MPTSDRTVPIGAESLLAGPFACQPQGQTAKCQNTIVTCASGLVDAAPGLHTLGRGLPPKLMSRQRRRPRLPEATRMGAVRGKSRLVVRSKIPRATSRSERPQGPGLRAVRGRLGVGMRDVRSEAGSSPLIRSNKESAKPGCFSSSLINEARRSTSRL